MRRAIATIVSTMLTALSLAIAQSSRPAFKVTPTNPPKTAISATSATMKDSEGEWLASPSIDPAVTVSSACGSPNPVVYFPEGVYKTTGNIALCSGLHLRCAGSNVIGAVTGSVIQLKPTAGPVWEFLNPNAGETNPGNQVDNVIIDDCVLDISRDKSSLGAIRVKGLLWSQFRGVGLHTNNNTNPGITFDGANYAGNGGNYNNEWFGLVAYDDASPSEGANIGLYFTDSSFSGACSNENHFHGGSITRYGIPIKIDCGNGNSFESVDIEDWVTHGVWLTYLGTKGSGGVAAQNLFINIRFESGASNSKVAIQEDPYTFNNLFIAPDHSGSYVGQVDASGQNACILCQFGNSGSSASPYQTLFNTDRTRGLEVVGINRTAEQVQADLSPYKGGLDVGGNLNVTGSVRIGAGSVPTVEGAPVVTTLACWKTVGSTPTLGYATIVDGVVSACK